jgi:hypothetical protein
MDVDPRERLVDLYNEMRTTDPDEFQYLSTHHPDEFGLWDMATRNAKLQPLIREALRLRRALGLD